MHGYNGQKEWRTLQKATAQTTPEALEGLLRDNRMKIHGGTSTWSSQQRASGFYERPALRAVVERICFGTDGRTPDQLDRDELVSRFNDAQSFGKEQHASPSLSFCSKLAHIYDPRRWAILNTRANAEMATQLGLAVEPVNSPGRYVAFCDTLEGYRTANGLPDLDMVDITFSHIYRELHDSRVG